MSCGPKVFGQSCRRCCTPLNVFHVGDGVHYELPCAFPGCDDGVPGDGYKVLTPRGSATFSRERVGTWRWMEVIWPPRTTIPPVEGDGWITVYP